MAEITVYESGYGVVVCDPCMVCGNRAELAMSPEEVKSWNDWRTGGMSIGRAFYSWPADRREMLLTGTHPEHWDQMVGPEPEDDE